MNFANRLNKREREIVRRALQGRELDLRHDPRGDSEIGTIVKMLDALRTADSDASRSQPDPITIGRNGLCECDCGTKCPLGKVGMETRCSSHELLAAGVPFQSKQIPCVDYMMTDFVAANFGDVSADVPPAKRWETVDRFRYIWTCDNVEYVGRYPSYMKRNAQDRIKQLGRWKAQAIGFGEHCTADYKYRERQNEIDVMVNDVVDTNGAEGHYWNTGLFCAENGIVNRERQYDPTVRNTFRQFVSDTDKERRYELKIAGWDMDIATDIFNDCVNLIQAETHRSWETGGVGLLKAGWLAQTLAEVEKTVSQMPKYLTPGRGREDGSRNFGFEPDGPPSE